MREPYLTSDDIKFLTAVGAEVEEIDRVGVSDIRVPQVKQAERTKMRNEMNSL